jgi:hypothetical protein
MFKEVKLYFDPYEKTFGDGTYPQLKTTGEGSKSVVVKFERLWVEIWDSTRGPKPILWTPATWAVRPEGVYATLAWVQMGWAPIDGLDGKCGPDLFELLERDTSTKSTGIVNTLGRFIFKEEEVANAISTVRHHAAMPYVMGGSLAKYQGLEETLEYLKRAHPKVLSLLPPEKIQDIIQDTIEEETK